MTDFEKQPEQEEIKDFNVQSDQHSSKAPFYLFRRAGKRTFTNNETSMLGWDYQPPLWWLEWNRKMDYLKIKKQQ